MANEDTSAATAASTDAAHVLLVEDDTGDALLIGELLREVGAAVVLERVGSLAQARSLVKGADCVLLDLGLPDSQGLNGLRQLLQIEPEAAIIILTGEANEHLGEQAVRAGARDYLVKGEVAGHMLNRVIMYAVERRRLKDMRQQLHEAQLLISGNKNSAAARQGHVFISYVSEDSPTVDRLQQDLGKAGIKVWRDRTSLGPGDRWKDEIRRAISSGTYFIYTLLFPDTWQAGVSKLVKAIQHYRY